MTEQRPRWVVGLRRSWVAGSMLTRWVVDDQVTGVVWTPASWIPDDAAEALVHIVEAGATPDAALLWDFAVSDVRDAATELRATFRDGGVADGYVAVWMDPERLVDPGRASAAADDLTEEIGRENIVPAFAWTPARAGSLTAIVAEGIPVAVSGVRDPEAVSAVRRAWEKGMDRFLKDVEEDEEVDDVPVFLLGCRAEVGEGALSAVDLVTESALVVPEGGSPPRLPLSPEAERIGRDEAVARLAARARRPAHDDEYAPQPFETGTAKRVQGLERAEVTSRIWKRDHTLWSEEPAEIADRLGWLDVAERMREEAGDLADWGRKVRAGGVSRVVLCGMGGSSLAPETFAGVRRGEVGLTVLDSTDPDHLAAVREGLDLERTLFVVSSKSGTTVETRSQLDSFWSLAGRGDRFVAVTDAGTPLAEFARERNFLRVFENPSDIGGRYSGLSYFGLVPAALCGIDIAEILDGALAMQTMCAPSVPARLNPAARLGGALGEAAAGESRDKLTLVLPGALAPLGAWVEQLVAESTGKEGKGILPVDGEDLGPPEAYGEDRVFVAYALGDEPFDERLGALEEAGHSVVKLRVPGAQAVGAEMYRWALATAVAGYELGVHPFDQPDVESSKQRTKEVLEGSGSEGLDRGSASEVLSGLEPPGFVAIQAFLAPSEEHARRLHAVRMRLRDRYRVAVTVGFGPRFLHSTGQLHKGGPEGGRFLQVTGPHTTDVDIPGASYTFGGLIDAQADGDLRALRDAGRPVARVSLDELDALG